VLYIDTSALAKLILEEPEPPALQDYLSGAGTVVSSAVALTELVRAACRVRSDLEGEARQLLEHVVLVNVDRRVLERAATLSPREIRTLDAIHLATAQMLGDELEVIVTYDARMGQAAREAGVKVDAPV